MKGGIKTIAINGTLLPVIIQTPAPWNLRLGSLKNLRCNASLIQALQNARRICLWFNFLSFSTLSHRNTNREITKRGRKNALNVFQELPLYLYVHLYYTIQLVQIDIFTCFHRKNCTNITECSMTWRTWEPMNKSSIILLLCASRERTLKTLTNLLAGRKSWRFTGKPRKTARDNYRFRSERHTGKGMTHNQYHILIFMQWWFCVGEPHVLLTCIDNMQRLFSFEISVSRLSTGTLV